MNINQFGASLGESEGWDDTQHHKALLNGSFEFSDTFLDDRLGVVAAFNHSGSYVRQLVLIGAQTFDRNATNNSSEVPVVNSWNFQDGPKPTWRDAAVLNLDFKVNENLTLSWNNSYNWYKAPFFNRNWVITADMATLATGFTTTNMWAADGTLIPAAIPQISNRTLDTARSTAVSASNSQSNAQVQGSNLVKSGGTFITTPSFTWETGRTTIDGSVSYSRSYNDYNSGSRGHFSQVTGRMNGVSWEYELVGENQITIRQLNTTTSNNADFLNIANYTQNLVATNEQRHALDQFWTANGDVTVRYDEWQMPTTFKFGADYRLNVRDIENFAPTWRINTSTSLNAAAAISLATYQDPLRSGIRQGEQIINIAGVAGPMPNMDEWRLYELFAGANMDPFAITANVGSNGTTVASVSQVFYNAPANAGANLRNYLQSQYDIKERVNSLYGMATVKLAPKVEGTIGARFESTRTEGRSFEDIGDAAALVAAPTPANYPGAVAQWRNHPTYVLARYSNRTTRTKSYDEILPSAQIRYEPSRNTVLRAAYYRSILRPDFGNVVGGVTVNDTATTFTVRNFELEPEFANNFDARVEYYFEPVGVISFGVFYKDISDLQINRSQLVDVDDLPPWFDDLGIVPGAGEVSVSQRWNIGSADLWGAEFDYSQQLSMLPDPWSGLGVFFNATYISPGDDDIFALTAEDGIAKHTFNTGVSYKKGRFDGRVSANIVGERLRGLTGFNIDADGVITPNTGANNTYRREFLAPKTQVDVNLAFELTHNATLFCNISNLFNEEQFRYNENADSPTRWGHYGRRYTIGVKGTF